MRRKEERKNEDGAKDERGEKKRGRGWEKRRGDRRWEMVEKRRTVQGVKKKKKKKKLRWSSAGSTTAAGGDDLLKATRSQPLGPKRGTTLLIFRCSLFSLSAPYSSRSLSLLLVPSFCLSHFRSLNFRASAFLELAELCMVLSLLPPVSISPSFFYRFRFIFLNLFDNSKK